MLFMVTDRTCIPFVDDVACIGHLFWLNGQETLPVERWLRSLGGPFPKQLTLDRAEEAAHSRRPADELWLDHRFVRYGASVGMG